MTNAIAIYRVSTSHQVESGNGLAAQRDSVRSYAAKNGLTIVSEHSDEGVSGAAPLDKREGLINALNNLKKGMVLLVHKMDRLSRDTFLALVIQRQVEKKGCRIVSASGEGNGTAPQDLLMRSLLVAFSEYEKNLVSIRTRNALAARKKQGFRTGTVPFGFSALPDGKLIENSTEQAVLELVRAARQPAHGKKATWTTTAQLLNDGGFTNRAGRPWTKQNAYLIFRNRV